MEQAKELAQQFMGGDAGQEAPAGDKQVPPGAAAPASGGGWMGLAQQAASQYMSGHHGQAQAAAPGAPAVGSGLMDMAQPAAGQFMGGHEGAPAGAGVAPDAPAAGGGLMGMAQQAAGQFVGGGDKAAGEGAGSGGSAAALMGVAQTFIGGGGGEKVGGVAPGGAGAADAGLVDKLLGIFEQKESKQFTGSEGEFDKLADLSHSVLGTPIGRDLLKMWVKQRLGI